MISADTLWDAYAGGPPSPEPLSGNPPAPMGSGATTLGTEVLWLRFPAGADACGTAIASKFQEKYYIYIFPLEF